MRIGIYDSVLTSVAHGYSVWLSYLMLNLTGCTTIYDNCFDTFVVLASDIRGSKLLPSGVRHWIERG